jgi:hypothetical protein
MMTDEQTDWLGLEDDGEQRKARGPAFVAGPQYGPAEIFCAGAHA